MMNPRFGLLAVMLGTAACVKEAAFTRAAPSEMTSSARVSTGDLFYTQRLDDAGIPILSHQLVSAEAMQAARERLERLLHGAPRLRRNLEAGRYELHIMALSQFPSDLPEYRSKRGTFLPNGEAFDWHMIGGHISETARHYSSCAEGTLIPVVGHRLFGDETCLHELAHAIENFALDGAARARIVAEFRESLNSGHWLGKYAARNPSEWFAEMTKFYFRADRPELAFYHPELAHGRNWFCEYDRRACEFVSALYSDRIDPGVPTTIHLPLQPGRLETSLRSLESRTPTRLIVRNHSAQRIHLVWVDPRGQRDQRRPFAEQESAGPGEEMISFTWKTHAFVITDDAERALCTVVAQDAEAVSDFSGPCP